MIYVTPRIGKNAGSVCVSTISTRHSYAVVGLLATYGAPIKMLLFFSATAQVYPEDGSFTVLAFYVHCMVPSVPSVPLAIVGAARFVPVLSMSTGPNIVAAVSLSESNFVIAE